jgi:hypothetical protein
VKQFFLSLTLYVKYFFISLTYPTCEVVLYPPHLTYL